MSYAQKIKGQVLQTIENQTTNKDEVNRDDLAELAIFFAGLSRVYANSVKRFDKKLEEGILYGSQVLEGETQ